VPTLAEGLYAVREALRERLPLAVSDERAERGVHVDALHRIADDEFYARGWLWDRGAPVAALTAVAPEGERVELLGEAFRHPRPEVSERFGVGEDDAAGFACRFRTRVPSRRADGWVLEMANQAGRGVETAARLASEDARDAIVADAGLAMPQAEELRERHVLPAVTRLQELRRDAVAVGEVETHGEVPAQPEVSVIVPLYERIDLLEHQIAQFADDPELRACELLYVLDSPADADHLRRFAAELWRLYGLPFRVAFLTGSGGVALARNLGAEVASGRRLLFLDSDVMPVAPGWLGTLAGALDAGAGAVAPKLLYHDGGIQHAGIGFERATDAPEWAAEPRFKGVHADLPAANVGGAVPALTGACLLTDRQLYRELGGMSWMYVKGEYEDADFCLRLAGAGRECRYVPEVALHHLEAQSYPPAARAANRRYNRWLFSRTWHAVLG
jgi:GT2 family glycosyltransferase